MFSAWENYQEWESTCPDCEWTGLLSQAQPDYETAMVSSLHCPNCDRKLALMSNQASFSEILTFAGEGSRKAINHLKNFKCGNCDKTEGLREAIYGEPPRDSDESRFYLAGHNRRGQGVVCILCNWGIGDEYA